MFAIWLIVGCGRLDFTNVVPDAPLPDAPVIDTPALRWTLVQTVAQAQSPLTIAPVGSEHLVVVAMQIAAGGTVTSVTDDAGSVYVAASGARAMDADDGLEIWYAVPPAGATTITVGSTTSVVVTSAWEVAGMRLNEPLDAAVALDDGPATTTPTGPTIETSAAGDFVVSVAIVANGVNNAIHTGNAFTNDHRTRGNGWAHLTDPGAPAASYQAEWDQPTAGIYCANAAAFRVSTQ